MYASISGVNLRRIVSFSATTDGAIFEFTKRSTSGTLMRLDW